MRNKQRTLICFDSRSVMLFTALTLGGTAALHAQTAATPAAPALTAPAEKTPAKPSTATDAFDRADVDHNGQLSPQEAALLPAIAQRFKELDTDGNGMLSRSEFSRASGS